MIYLRKIFKHDITHEISVTTSIVDVFFEKSTNFSVKGKTSNFSGNVTINNATDPRFGGDIKKIIQNEISKTSNIQLGIDDMIIFYKDNKSYILEIIQKDDDRFATFSSLFIDKERHQLFLTDDFNNSSSQEEILTEYTESKNIQKIYYGAPGTGKSYAVSQLINEYYKSSDDISKYVFRVTVYSDYSYYSFIGNIMPISKNNEISYDFKEGIFTKALATAFKNPSKNIFLVIEEMTRGDIAAIFGDIFQLLDRDNNGKSEYSINNDLISHYLKSEGLIEDDLVYLPSNFHILGTINTTDQNVNVLDTAFKRRFEFEYISTDPINTSTNNFSFKLLCDEKECSYNWIKLYTVLNLFIVSKLNLSEDKQIGHFFIKFTENDDDNYDLIKNKLLHYLWEDVQNISYANNESIFDKNYKTFSELYKAFSNKEDIFSLEFRELYESM